MIDDIKRFFQERLAAADEDGDDAHTIRLATAALLIELSRADDHQDELEQAVIQAMLFDAFEITEDELAELINLADEAARGAHDMYQFTQLVNEHYAYPAKMTLIRNLWEVAFADGRLDRYEEQFIRKVAGLIHVPHSDFIKAKVEVLARLEAGDAAS